MCTESRGGAVLPPAEGHAAFFLPVFLSHGTAPQRGLFLHLPSLSIPTGEMYSPVRQEMRSQERGRPLLVTVTQQQRPKMQFCRDCWVKNKNNEAGSQRRNTRFLMTLGTGLSAACLASGHVRVLVLILSHLCNDLVSANCFDT